jgi:hypothetical protein
MPPPQALILAASPFNPSLNPTPRCTCPTLLCHALLRGRVAELEAELEAAAADSASSRAHLLRLKQQMLSEQEDEEEKVRWRVAAELKLERERVAVAEQGGGGQEAAAWREELAAARARVEKLEDDAVRWEEAVAARDAELQNLQRALGEPGVGGQEGGRDATVGWGGRRHLGGEMGEANSAHGGGTRTRSRTPKGPRGPPPPPPPPRPPHRRALLRERGS